MRMVYSNSFFLGRFYSGFLVILCLNVLVAINRVLVYVNEAESFLCPDVFSAQTFVFIWPNCS